MASDTTQEPAPERKSRLRRWIIILLCIGTVIYFGADHVFVYTDDAYVRSDFVPLAPEVDGIVQSVAVTDNQPVRTGDLLLQLDPEPHRLALALKRDQVTAALAEVNQKTAAAAEITSRNDSASAASRQVDVAKAAVETAQAEMAIAAYALSRTEVKAPVDGYVTNLTLRPGMFARAGTPLIGIVDLNRFRIIANFKEYVAASLAPGTTVWIWLDSHPWRLFRGRVSSIGRGIARSDTPDLLLPYVPPSTNWIRLLRRLPVTIVFDPPVPPETLFMGADARVLIFR